MKTQHRHLLSLGILLAAANFASAAPLVYEGFNGYTAGNMNGQLANGNTVGLDTAGASGTYAVAGSAATFQSTGLSLGTLAVSGGSVSQTTTTASTFGIGLNAGTVTGDLFGSYLINFTTAGTATAIAWNYINDTQTTATNRRFAAIADGNTTSTTGVGYDGPAANGTYSAQTLAGGTTYMVLSQFTNVGTALSVGTPGVGTVWVLDAAQYDNFASSGFTVSALNSATIGTGATQVTSRISDTVTTGTFDFTSSRFLTVGLLSNSATQTYTIDEMRYGTTLLDAVPEPSVTALLAGGMVFGLFMKRSRRHTGMRE